MVEDIGFTRRFWVEDYSRFPYAPSPWKRKIITNAELEDANFLMVVPEEVAKLHARARLENNPDSTVWDRVSDLPIQRVHSFLRDVEKFTIAEPEPLQLIRGIASNIEGIWSHYSQALTSAKIVKEEAAL